MGLTQEQQRQQSESELRAIGQATPQPNAADPDASTTLRDVDPDIPAALDFFRDCYDLTADQVIARVAALPSDEAAVIGSGIAGLQVACMYFGQLMTTHHGAVMFRRIAES